MMYGPKTVEEFAQLIESLELGDRSFSSQARGTTTYNVDCEGKAIRMKGAFVPGYAETKGPQKTPKTRGSAGTRASFQSTTNEILEECGRKLAAAVAMLAAETPEGKGANRSLVVGNPFQSKSAEYTTLYLKTSIDDRTTWVNARGEQTKALELDKLLAEKDSKVRVELFLDISSVTVSETSPDVTFQLRVTDVKKIEAPLSRVLDPAYTAQEAATSPAQGSSRKRARPTPSTNPLSPV